MAAVTVPNVGAVISIAAANLNDTQQAIWTESRLMPHVKAAVNWFATNIANISTQYFTKWVGSPYTPTDIPYKAGVVDLTPVLPADLYEPQSLEFRLTQAGRWNPMSRATSLPTYICGNSMGVGGTSPSQTQADDETPQDTGDHQHFLLSFAPYPALSLQLYNEGQLLAQITTPSGPGDYTLIGSLITFKTALTGTWSLQAFYTYATPGGPVALSKPTAGSQVLWTWEWSNRTLRVSPCMNNAWLRLRYLALMPDVNSGGDPIPIDNCVMALGYATSAFAYASRGQATQASAMWGKEGDPPSGACMYLGLVLDIIVKNEQELPRRPVPFSGGDSYGWPSP